MKPQLDCKDVQRLISVGQDQTLPAAERARLRLHFVIGETCRNVSKQMDFLCRAMRQPGRADRALPKSSAALPQ